MAVQYTSRANAGKHLTLLIIKENKMSRWTQEEQDQIIETLWTLIESVFERATIKFDDTGNQFSFSAMDSFGIIAIREIERKFPEYRIAHITPPEKNSWEGMSLR
jgi:hypothetical protein